jgi:glycosyltransferase involved in cell wall biosynthesis
MARTVLINAGPWLAVPPPGYGGIENVLATLIPELRARGHKVVLASVAESTIEVERLVSVFDEGQFDHLGGPYTRVVGLAQAHMQRVVAELRESDDVDVVHDHQEVLGAATLANLDGAPPALQTLHWDLAKHGPFYRCFDGRGRVFFNGVSERQVETAPLGLRRQTLAAVPLAVPVGDFDWCADKDDYFACVGRLTPEKGVHVAARICAESEIDLRIAGPVAGFRSEPSLSAALARENGRYRALRDVAYYLEDVRPLENGHVRWIGALGTAGVRRLMRRARATLFPVQWEEPGATAAIESLACGTPVIALRRGALGNIVEHGVTGFLAADEQELAGYLTRAGEIDPARCRQAAEEYHAPALMAQRYEDLYEQVIERASAVDREDGLEHLVLARRHAGE